MASDVGSQPSFGRVKGARVSEAHVVVPTAPRLATKVILEGHEQGVAVQPVRISTSEVVELVFQVSTQATCRGGQEASLPSDHGSVVDAASRMRVERDLPWREKVIFDQQFGADEQRIACRVRKALVRGIPV